LGAVQIAETLAGHGFVVAAPDHVGGDLFSGLEGTSTGFTPTTLATRTEDVNAVLAAVHDGQGLSSDAALLLEGVVSADEVGLIGHSFGVTTINTVHREDDRVGGLMALAGPLNVFGEAPADEVTVPLLALRSSEDNTIGEVGNDLIRSQFDEVPQDKWFIDVLDAGHYSFLDICGLLDQFGTGCGEDQRQTDQEELFSYLSPSRARALTATYAVAFFSLVLKNDTRGRDLLFEKIDAAVVGPEFTAAL
jgi:predicted dienelactone hydrolase